MQPSVDVVIVNWNTGPQLRACLRSIVAAGQDRLALRRVVVVDNASSDGSASSLGCEGLPLQVLHNDENRGFAAACNQGARGSSSDYLLFLNPDTELFADSLAVPLAYMERPESRDVGICGIRLVEADGTAGVACARFPTPAVVLYQALGLSRVWPSVFRPHLLPSAECRVTRDVDQVIGAYFLVRRRLFEELDGFDERFFVYFEEVDFSLRARQRGFRSTYLAGATALHHGGLSSGQVRARRLFYSLRSRLLYAFKHFTGPGAALVVIVTVCVEPVARLGAALLRGSGREIGETLRAYGMLGTYWWRRLVRW